LQKNWCLLTIFFIFSVVKTVNGNHSRVSGVQKLVPRKTIGSRLSLNIFLRPARAVKRDFAHSQGVKRRPRDKKRRHQKSSKSDRVFWSTARVCVCLLFKEMIFESGTHTQLKSAYVPRACCNCHGCAVRSLALVEVLASISLSARTHTGIIQAAAIERERERNVSLSPQ
jgi:hypothetical protein